MKFEFPCSLADTVYVIRGFSIEKGKVEAFLLDFEAKSCLIEMDCGDSFWTSLYSFGCKIFLSELEAENMLEALKNETT